MKILILSLVLLLVFVLYWYFKKRKVVTTTTTTLSASSTTTTTINNDPVIFRSILVARPLVNSVGTIDICGKSPTDSEFVDLGSIMTLYFLGSSVIPDNGVQLYIDSQCTIPYSRSENSLLAMKTDDGEGVFDYYDLYITINGTVSGFFKCETSNIG